MERHAAWSSPTSSARRVACAALLSLVVPAAHAQRLRTDFPVTDGGVSAMALSGDTLYLGGSFHHVAPFTGPGIPLSAADARPWPSFPRIEGSVDAVIPDGSGGWFIGGMLGRVGQTACGNLVHVLANGDLSSWRPGVQGQVWTLLRSGDRLYAGGSFQVGGGASRGLSAWSISTGALADWDPRPHGVVTALAISGTTLYVGGEFDSLASRPCARFGALDLDADTLRPGFPAASGAVSSIVSAPGRLYLAGTFSTLGGLARTGLGAVDASNGDVLAWAPQVAQAGVDGLAASASTLYAVGASLESVDGQPRQSLAAFDLETGALLPWAPGAPGLSCRDIAVDGSRVYAIGTQLIPQLPVGLAEPVALAFDADSGQRLDWDPRLAGGRVRHVAAGGGSVYVAGEISGAGGAERPGLAALDARTGALLDWQPPLQNPWVSCLRAAGSRLYVGGLFAVPGDPGQRNLVALDRATGAVLPWRPGPDDQVQDIALLGDTLYALGWFEQIGGKARSRLAAVSARTGLATDWNPSVVYSGLETLAASDGRVFLGGHFSQVGDQPRQNIAALDPVTGAPLPWNGASDDAVLRLVAAGDRVFAGGGFHAVDGEPRLGLATLDAASGDLLPAPGASPVQRIVLAVAVAGTRVFAGGNDVHDDASLRDDGCLAGFDLGTGDELGGLPNVGLDLASTELVLSLAGDDRSVFVGGGFSTVDRLFRHALAAVDLATSGVEVPPGGRPDPVARFGPSPWRGAGRLTLVLGDPGPVTAALHDLAGRRVADVVREPWLPAGAHRFALDGDGLPAGVYLLHVRAGRVEQTLKLVKLR